MSPVNRTARSTLRQSRNMSEPEESRSSCIETNGTNDYSLANEEMYSERSPERDKMPDIYTDASLNMR